MTSVAYQNQLVTTEATAVPKFAKDWKSVLERTTGVEYNMYDMDMHVVFEDAVYLSRETISTHTTFHCEPTVSLHAMKRGNKMYSYIGASNCPDVSFRYFKLWKIVSLCFSWGHKH